MLPMSPQQQFELAKQVAISNPSRLQAVLRGQPDPIFSDLNIAMMALRGAADLRKSMEGAQAAQQTQQPSVKDQMVAQMDQETAQLGGVANLQAPNMDIPNGGVAGEEEPPIQQAASGGTVRHFQVGGLGLRDIYSAQDVLPEDVIRRGERSPHTELSPKDRAAKIREALKELERQRRAAASVVPPSSASVATETGAKAPSLLSRGLGAMGRGLGTATRFAVNPITALTAGLALHSPEAGAASDIVPGQTAGRLPTRQEVETLLKEGRLPTGLFETQDEAARKLLNRIDQQAKKQAGQQEVDASMDTGAYADLMASTTPPSASRAAPPSAPAATAETAPKKEGIARLYGDPKSVFADIDSIPDPAEREEVRRAYMEQLRTQGVLQEPKTGVDTLTSSFDPASVRTQIAAARKRSLEDARAATAPQWEAVQKLWSKDEANREEKLSDLERGKRGLAALAAAGVLGAPGQTGMGAISKALETVGGIGAKYDAEKRKLVQNFNDAEERRVLAGLAYEQGNFALATKLADQEQHHVDTAAKLAYDVAHKRVLEELEGRKLTETERNNMARVAAENARTRVLESHYGDMRLQYSASEKNAQRAALQGQLTSLATLINSPITPKDDRELYINQYKEITKQLSSMAGLRAETPPPPSDFRDKLPPGAKVSGSLG